MNYNSFFKILFSLEISFKKKIDWIFRFHQMQNFLKSLKEAWKTNHHHFMLFLESRHNRYQSLEKNPLRLTTIREFLCALMAKDRKFSSSVISPSHFMGPFSYEINESSKLIVILTSGLDTNSKRFAKQKKR